METAATPSCAGSLRNQASSPSSPHSSCNARNACCGTTPLPAIRNWAVRDKARSSPQIQSSGRPIIHSTKPGFRPRSSTGSGAGRPISRPHWSIAAPYGPQSHDALSPSATASRRPAPTRPGSPCPSNPSPSASATTSGSRIPISLLLVEVHQRCWQRRLMRCPLLPVDVRTEHLAIPRSRCRQHHSLSLSATTRPNAFSRFCGSSSGRIHACELRESPSGARGLGRSRAASIASDAPCPFPLPCRACMSAVHASHSATVLPAPMSFTTGVGNITGCPPP